jgi:hypothetical protein
MAVPSYGEYVSLAELYERRDQGADVVVGSPPVTPGFVWQVEAPELVDTSNIYIGMEDMERVLRISEVCGAVVRSYVDTTPLVDLTPVAEPLVVGSRKEGRLEDFYPLWTVDIDKTTTERAMAHFAVEEDMPLDAAWARGVNSALVRGIAQAARVEHLLDDRMTMLGRYLGGKLLKTEADF